MTASRNATAGAAVDNMVALLGASLAGADVGAAFFLFFRGAGVGAVGAGAAFGVGPTEVFGRLIGVKRGFFYGEYVARINSIKLISLTSN